ncbi:MAG: VWA domain-containing protein [Acidaminobacteraceae bacterium]
MTKSYSKEDNITCHFTTSNPLDLSIFNNIFTTTDRIIKNTTYLQNYKISYEFFEDIFTYLFKENSSDLLKSNDLNEDAKFNKLIFDEFIMIDTFEALKSICNLNYYNSILAVDILSVKMTLSFELLKRNSSDFMRIYNSNDLDLQDRKSMLLLLKENNIFSLLVSDAYNDFLSVTSTIKSWGLNDHRLKADAYEEKFQVSLKLKKLKKVRNIAEMSGRFKASASKLKKKNSKEDGQELCGVHVSDEIHRTLPSEKLLLTKKETKLAFYKKYHQKELLTYKYRNNKLKSKGPIICCIDTSASMQGELEIWSKSVAIALMDIAIKEKRDFVAIMFSNKVYKTIHFNKNRVEPSKLYDLATFFYGSGTNFVEPLNEAIKLINTARYKYSDIIFITDGKAPMDDEFIEKFLTIKEKKHFRMITVNVSNNYELNLNKINDIQLLLKYITEEQVDEINDVIFDI